MPAVYPAFFFVLEKGSKSAGNAVIPTYPMHWSHGLQGSLKRCYKHPFPAFMLSSMSITRQKMVLAQLPHVCFHEQKRVHTHLRQQDRTQRLTRRNRDDSDGGAITTLGLFHTFRKPCVARGWNGKLCRFWVLVGGALEECREPAGQRCAYACRCPEASRPRRAAQTNTAR